MKRMLRCACKHNTQQVRTSASSAAAASHKHDVTLSASVTSQADETVMASGCPFGFSAGKSERGKNAQSSAALECAKSFNDIPGPPRLPLLGNVLAYSKLGS